MSENTYNPSKLKEFLANLKDCEDVATDQEDSAYSAGYEDGYKDGQAQMFELLMSLSAEQQRILYKFCNSIFVDGLSR